MVRLRWVAASSGGSPSIQRAHQLRQTPCTLRCAFNPSCTSSCGVIVTWCCATGQVNRSNSRRRGHPASVDVPANGAGRRPEGIRGGGRVHEAWRDLPSHRRRCGGSSPHCNRRARLTNDTCPVVVRSGAQRRGGVGHNGVYSCNETAIYRCTIECRLLLGILVMYFFASTRGQCDTEEMITPKATGPITQCTRTMLQSMDAQHNAYKAHHMHKTSTRYIACAPHEFKMDANTGRCLKCQPTACSNNAQAIAQRT